MFKDIATIVATLFSSLDTIKRHSLLIGNNSLAEQMTGLAIDLDNVDEDVAPLSLFDDRDGTADGVARSLSQKSGGDAEGSLGTRSQAYRGATHDKEVSARISADRRSQLATRILDAVRGKLGGGSEREAERAMTSEVRMVCRGRGGTEGRADTCTQCLPDMLLTAHRRCHESRQTLPNVRRMDAVRVSTASWRCNSNVERRCTG